MDTAWQRCRKHHRRRRRRSRRSAVCRISFIPQHHIMNETPLQSWRSHARSEDRSSHSSFTPCTILRTTHRVLLVHHCHIHCIFLVQPSIRDPRPFVSCSYGLRLVGTRQTSSCVISCCITAASFSFLSVQQVTVSSQK